MLAAQAIIDNPMLVNSNPAINPRHQIFMAVLAKSFLKRRSHPDFMFHGNPYCHLDVFVRKSAVFLKHFLGMLKQKINAPFCNFLLLSWFSVVFFWHFLLIFIFFK